MKLVILLEYNWCTTGEVGNIIGDKMVYIWWYNWRGLGDTSKGTFQNVLADFFR